MIWQKKNSLLPRLEEKERQGEKNRGGGASGAEELLFNSFSSRASPTSPAPPAPK